MSSPLIPGGCILIARKIIESEIWDKPPLYLKVWTYLLLKAQHSDYKGLRRGQLITSMPEIIEAVSWKVGARRERPTKDQIYQIIDWMRKPRENHGFGWVESPKNGENERNTEENTTSQRILRESNTKATMIATTKATHSMLVTIDNYGIYQTFSSYESNAEGNDEKAMKGARKQRQPDNINKNGNNDKNEQEKRQPLLEIENFRLRYSESQLKHLDNYFEMIRHTRRSAKISANVVSDIYKKFDCYPTICVEHAVRTHYENSAHHSRQENYTVGILSKTDAAEASRKLGGVVPFKQPERTERWEKEVELYIRPGS